MSVSDSKHDKGQMPHDGVHATEPGEKIKSRSEDPGQGSYGGFKNENPAGQAQQLDPPKEKKDAR